MFDLQLLAYKTEITRISTMMLARENSNISFPASGVREGFHNASHHSNERANKDQYARINNYHIGLLAGFLEKMANTPDGERNMLENSMILYGSGNSDGNRHTHVNLPLILAGSGGGSLNPGAFRRFNAIPMSNLLLGLGERMGVSGVPRLGDSTGVLQGV